MDKINSAFLLNVMDLLLDAICVVDAEGRFVFVSAAGERIFGYSAAEMIGQPVIEFVYAEDRERTMDTIDEIVSGQPKPHFENRYLRKDGRVVHILWSARWSATDQVRVAVAHDITERKRAESVQAALYAISEAAYTSDDLLALFQRIHGIIGGLLPAINCFVALYDAARDELSFPYFVDEHDTAPPPRPLDSGTLSADIIRTGRALRLTRAAEGDRPGPSKPDVGRQSLDWLGVPLSGHAGIIGALVVQIYSGDLRYTDADTELLQFVSTQVAAAIERKRTEARLQHSALHDVLTDLPNRALFHDRLKTALAWSERDQTLLAVMYLDLDGFKQVNDREGHAAGDLLLQEVARRLQRSVRGSDTVARIGGDEFVVLLGGLHLAEHAEAIAEKIRVAISQPVELPSHRLQVSPSIGIAFCAGNGEDHEALIRRADTAMYTAKKEGGNRIRVATDAGRCQA